MEFRLSMETAQSLNESGATKYSERLIILRGNGSLFFNEAAYPFQCGDIIQLPPSCDYTLEEASPCMIGRMEILDFLATQREVIVIPADQTALIRRMFLLALDLDAMPMEPYFQSRIHSLMSSLIWECSLAVSVSMRSYHPAVSAVVQDILVHFHEPEYSLSAVLERQNYHPTYVAKLFRDETGLAPKEFLIQQRIDRAKELLRKSDSPVQKISLDAGFSDPAYFTRQFRQHEGVSPTEYRRMVTEPGA